MIQRFFCYLISGLLLLACAARPAPAASMLSKEDLLAAVKSIRSGIDDLSIEHTETMIGGDAGHLKHVRLYKILLKGQMAVVDETFGPDPKVSQQQFHIIGAFNGTVSMHFQVNDAILATSSKRMPTSEVRDIFFFECNLLNRDEVGSGRENHSLISLLSAPQSRLVATKELIDGHACYVIETSNPETKLTNFRVWLDPDRGYVPLRILYFTNAPPGGEMIEVKASEVTQIAGKFWFVTRAQRHVFPVLGAEENRIEIAVVTKGESAAILVNSGIPDDSFDLVSHAPAGTVIANMDTGKSYTATRGRLEESASLVRESTKQAPLTIPARSTSNPGGTRLNESSTRSPTSTITESQPFYKDRIFQFILALLVIVAIIQIIRFLRARRMRS